LQGWVNITFFTSKGGKDFHQNRFGVWKTPIFFLRMPSVSLDRLDPGYISGIERDVTLILPGILELIFIMAMICQIVSLAPGKGEEGVLTEAGVPKLWTRRYSNVQGMSRLFWKGVFWKGGGLSQSSQRDKATTRQKQAQRHLWAFWGG